VPACHSRNTLHDRWPGDFLYGISYYAGLGASEEFLQKDLDDMKRYGFNWIRVWDPERLVTASHGGDISRDELREYLQTVAVDFISPHRPRAANSPAQSRAKSEEYIRWMKELGGLFPVHYQEPFRRGSAKWEPTAGDFITDARQARLGGAAGWCLHNGAEQTTPGGRPRRSFDLREKRLFDQLDGEERKAMEELRKLSSSTQQKISN